MGLWVAAILTLLYGVASPLGDRVRAASGWAAVKLASAGRAEGAGGGEVSQIQWSMTRGWPSLLWGDLWLLPLLAGIIGLFHFWWLGAVLPAIAFGLRFILHRLGAFPRTLGWYLSLFRGRLLREVDRLEEKGADDEAARLSVLAQGLSDLEAAHASVPLTIRG
jgi:hypothetical protein